MCEANTRQTDPFEKLVSEAHIPGGMCSPKLGLFKKTFFLVHHLYPHHPYVYNEKCEKKDHGNYKINYNCTLLKIKDLQNFLRKNDPNSTVIFISDHGLKLQVQDNKKSKGNYQVGIKNFQIDKKTKYEFSSFPRFSGATMVTEKYGTTLIWYEAKRPNE